MRGRGASYRGRSRAERRCGRYTRENVGMSSERRVRIPSTENLRFPEEGSSTQGKSGPKPRPKGVGDGQQVKDSCTTKDQLNEVGTQKDRISAPLVERAQAASLIFRQIRISRRVSCDGEGKQVPKYLNSYCQEKPLVRSKVPVPQTDTGR